MIASNCASGESSSEDVNELIIHCVRARPEIWDMRNKYYKDNNVRANKWAEIAREMNVKDEFVKCRWRSIRDRLVKKKRKLVTKSGQAATNSSTWPLMPLLEFLQDVIEPRSTFSNFNTYKKPETFVESQCLSSAAHEEMVLDDISSEIGLDIFLPSTSRLTSTPTPLCPIPTPTPPQLILTPTPPRSTPTPTPPRSCESSGSGRNAKRAKTESMDQVDEAILQLAQAKPNENNNLNNFTSDELFYLSISRDSQCLNIKDKMRLKLTVVNTLAEMLNNNETL